MNLENDIEIRDTFKKISVKVTSQHKMRQIDLIDNAIILLKQMAKTIRDTHGIDK